MEDTPERLPADTHLTALVLAGGVGLGAYQAGVYAALQAHAAPRSLWVAGSSIGAINAAVIAGSDSEHRIEKLRALWNSPSDGALLGGPDTDAVERWRHAESWVSALRSRMLGTEGSFRPRVPVPWEQFKSFYDLAPLRDRLNILVDFGRLNSGETRISIGTTDIETGELVLFDNARGDRIGIDHLLASCGYLPEFAPVEVDGRLLGDGGLSANAPIEALLHHRPDGNLAVYVVDLFPRDGVRPTDLETAAARKTDLTFANQTWLRLEGFCREERLRAQIRNANEFKFATNVYYLSYRPDSSEAGSERMYDYSARTIASRWHAGEADLRAALARIVPFDGANLIPIRRPDDERGAQGHEGRPASKSASAPRNFENA